MKKYRMTGKTYIFIAGFLVLGVAVWGLFFSKPVPTGVKAGEDIVVKIAAEQVSDMYGYQFELCYDKADFSYNGGITSSVPEISTIFAKEFDDHLLVGATKIGKETGFSGNQTQVCEITLTANKDCELSGISISGVNIVQSDLTYMEDVTDWMCQIKS